MDKDYFNFGGFAGVPPYYGYDPNNVEPNTNDGYGAFNPVMQYEQAYMYYRYLAKQMEYKIKCKEYEKLASSEPSRNSRKIE